MVSQKMAAPSTPRRRPSGRALVMTTTATDAPHDEGVVDAEIVDEGEGRSA